MSSWNRFQQHFHRFSVGVDSFALDLSRAFLPVDLLEQLAPRLKVAHAAMKALESGAIANPSEKRMVGHYWLRAPELAPSREIGDTIRAAVRQVEEFAADIHAGKIQGAQGAFKNILCVGIGGSALGPQLVAAALGQPGRDKLTPYFLDNTDPDGFDYVFAQLKGELGRTLVIVTSKSGGTIETANGMKETAAAYAAAGLKFNEHTVAITGTSGKLHDAAVREKFLATFPMWDWVGGRTSVLSAVGLLPAALQGLDIRGLLAGAKAMDELTRAEDPEQNPAALLAAAWYSLTGGKGEKDMVVLPYKDRLLLFARYLQQLVMESLGKKEAFDGSLGIPQGIAVYGNKGSTDQHAFVQQLRDGVQNFFATFIEVLRDREAASPDVQGETAKPSVADAPCVTSGDYLQGFFLGTRFALAAGNRPSITLTLGALNAGTLGALIALFERTVGIYANLINVNAYDQPGVEAGKKAADFVIAVEKRVLEVLLAQKGRALSVAELSASVDIAAIRDGLLAKASNNEVKAMIRDAEKIILEAKEELIFKVCEHLVANRDKHVEGHPDKSISLSTYNHI